MKLITRAFNFAVSASFLVFLAACSPSAQDGKDNKGAKAAGKNTSESVADSKSKRPNVMLIVIDDLGFNDLGVFGSEINTPNMDSLANEGVVLTDFMVAPNCSPTRAMLLSGTDAHIAGLGNMAESIEASQEGKPGYEGYLNFRVAALPELFQDAGFHTYMSGKWHLGLDDFNGPDDRGFERSFAVLQGGAGAFSNMLSLDAVMGEAPYSEDGVFLDSLPEDYYSTQYQADKMIEYIDSNQGDGKPFFSYLAFTSPHWPLQAPEASIAKYKGKYDEGYDVLKQRRLQAIKDRGLVANDVVPFPRLPGEKAWDDLSDEEKRYEARIMEIYAAMVDDVDIYLGKVIDYLKAIGEYDNTFIFFTSDNGPEAHPMPGFSPELVKAVEKCCDNSYENLGKANSYVGYGQNWGQSGNTPLRMYKGYPAQGGVRVPAFVRYPAGISAGVQTDAMLTAKDLAPTLLEFAGIEHPGTRYRDRDVAEMTGSSMLPLLTGKVEAIHSDEYVMGWELFGKRSIRKGEWKINYLPHQDGRNVKVGGMKLDTWQLYKLSDDPAEMNDLAEKHPQKLAEMISEWDKYVEENGVVIPDEIKNPY